MKTNDDAFARVKEYFMLESISLKFQPVLSFTFYLGIYRNHNELIEAQNEK